VKTTKILILGAVVLAAQVAADGTFAQPRQRTIECPHERIALEIKSEVPRGWQFVTNGAPLRRAVVREREDVTWLVCDYGEAGNLRREPPATAQTCEATATGFVCRADPPRRRLISRNVVLKEGTALNLDNGRLVDRLSKGELAYLGNTGRYGQWPMVSVLEGAGVALGGPDVTRIRDCAELPLRRGGIITLGREVRLGDAICFRSRGGTVGMLTFEDFSRDGVRFSYDALRRRGG
jgi:hypothetical protein